MLVQFVVDNFLSFGSRQELSMFAGKSRSYQQRVHAFGNKALLKFSALFGSNASGKSNLMKAMAFMDDVVERGRLPSTSTSQYCRTNADNKHRPSYFETIILLKDECYSYGFEVLLSAGVFTSEWLIKLGPKGEEYPIFERDLVTGKTQIVWDLHSEGKERFALYAHDVRKDSKVLLLSMMNTNKNQLYVEYPELDLLQAAYQWFVDVFEARDPMTPITSGARYLIEERLQEISQILSDFDTNIISIESIELPSVAWDDQIREFITYAQEALDDQQGNANTRQGVLFRSRSRFVCIYGVPDEDDWSVRTFSFKHEDGQLYQSGEESDGTLRIMDLAEILLTNGPKVFVIDELNRSLHPQLTYKFVERLLAHIQSRPIQVIVTTHESRLLDFELLRRDEIWFVEKREGESSIYSLEEYNERIDRKIDKAYLEGRYGGVPVFSEAVDEKRAAPAAR